ALALEADVRKRMILSQICVQIPLSTALLSSFEEGLNCLKISLKSFIVRAPISERAALLMQQLIFSLDDMPFFNEQDKTLLRQVFELEHCFAKQLSRQHIETLTTPLVNIRTESEALPRHKAISLSPLLGVTYLPLSYWQLKQELCSVEPQLLWRELQNNPVLIEQRVSLFSSMTTESSKCIISLPRLLSASETDATFDLHIIEMIGGFLPLLNKVDGTRSLDDILQLFSSAGASESVIAQAEQGFQTLFKEACITYK
ncbi:MAG: hypothetical protein KAG18_06975, partial [Sinobacterium sp.]|nr:hypothetical protein [Sinobacterium sp.]